MEIGLLIPICVKMIIVNGGENMKSRQKWTETELKLIEYEKESAMKKIWQK